MVAEIAAVAPKLASAQLTGRASLLELMLPAGAARRAVVLGANCPPALRPEEDGLAGSGGSVDLCILAPTEGECRSEAWVAGAAAEAAARLAPDGLVYILAAPRWRGLLLRTLSGHGLHYQQAWQHQPDPTTSRYLLPLERHALAFTYGGLIPVRPWRRRLALTAMFVPGWGRVAAIGLTTAGLIVRRPGSRPLLEWLLRAAGIEGRGQAIISSSWRGHGTVVLYVFGPHQARPDAVAKTALSAEETRGARQEAENLVRLASVAAMAGAETPALLASAEIGGRSVVMQTVVSGRPASQVLAVEPDRLDALLARLAAWLRSWHAASRQERPLSVIDLKRWILQPASDLADDLAGGDVFAARLAELCAAVAGQNVPMVATHGDLTMANVLIGGLDGRPGVVDWEQAQAAGLPLTDFFYSAADAVAASTGYRDRAKAFADCFLPGGSYTETVRRHTQRLAASLELTPPLVDLCFYSCWLQHAEDERIAARPGEPRPFLALLQRAAGCAGANRESVPEWQ